MEPVLGIAVLWLAFGASHVLLSGARLRPRLVARLGASGFLGLYSLIALATFVPLVWLYLANRHSGPLLWYLGSLPGMRWLVYLAMGAAFALVVGGVARPSPASLSPGKPEAAGVLRITRHPLFMGFGLFGLAHLLAAVVNAAELAFFGGFPLFAWIGCRHQDARKLAAGDDGFRAFHAATVFWPFSAPGQVPAALREDAVAIAVGVVLAIVVRVFHPQLFGG